MVSSRLAQYQCTQCKSIRRLSFDQTIHGFNVQNSLNGLVVYSDIHKCSDGLLGVNNLQVDAHFTMRGLENLQLPTERKPKNSLMGFIPSPAMKHEENHFKISNLYPDGTGFRLTMKDNGLKAEINLGEVFEEDESEISIIKGDLGMITLSLYPSEIYFTSTLEIWFHKFVNLLEILLPPKLGCIIEVFRYIYEHHNEDIEENYILLKTVKTILTAHEIRIKPSYHPDRFDWLAVDGSVKYGQKSANLMMKVLVDIEMDPEKLLMEYLGTWRESSIDMISLMISMEEDHLVSLIRPMDHWI